MMHDKDDTNAPTDLSDEQLEQVAGGTPIDFNTRHGMKNPRRPSADSLLSADRLGQTIPGQWDPTGDKGLDDALPA
jgi:hypothetical protein